MWISNPLVLLAVTLGGCLAADDHWTYSGAHGPSFWPKDFCLGSKQSPVDIDVGKTEYNEYLDDVDPITLKAGSTMKMGNNGHAVYLKPEATIHMAGAGLNDMYHVFGPHFHWGQQNHIGSEHSVDGKFFPLEMHIVTYNVEKYTDLTAAVGSGDKNALAVFGVFFELEAENNTAFQPIIENLSAVKEAKSAEVDVTLSLQSLLPPITEDYYRYEGSLTTPTCNEVVIWTLFKTPVPISQYQLDAFRQVLDTEGESLVNNYRPIQELNGRTVYRSFTLDIQDDDPDNQASPLRLSVLCTGLVLLLSAIKLLRGLAY